MTNLHPFPRRAFTLIELLVVIAIIALLVSILLPALREARVSAKQSQNFANLKQFGTATQSYSADFQDRVWAFTWRAPVSTGQRVNYRTQFADIANATEDVQAAHFQAVDIIRRRAQPEFTNFPTQGPWIPHVFYSHLVLMDYLAARLPEPMIHSPFDKLRAQWQAAVSPSPQAAADRLLASVATPDRYRWLFSSSYETVSASYTPDKFTADGSLQQNGDAWGSYLYTPGGGNTPSYRLGNRKLGDIAFPSNKVHLFENVYRIPKQELFFIHKAAKNALVTFDGSVKVVNTIDMNLGGYLRFNNTVQRMVITYDGPGRPEVGFPATAGQQNLTEAGRHRWTVGGLKGADFGQSEPFR